MTRRLLKLVTVVTFPLSIGGALAFLRAGTDFSELLFLAHRSAFRNLRTE